MDHSDGVRARSQALYVMQNSSGLIKIGRSATPEKRRRNLETQSGKPIALVAVLPGQGMRELEVHAALHEYRRLGEWFSDHAAVKQTLMQILGLSEMQFPYSALARAREKKEASDKRRRASANTMAAWIDDLNAQADFPVKINRREWIAAKADPAYRDHLLRTRKPKGPKSPL